MNRPAAQTLPIGTATAVIAALECMRPLQWVKNLFVLSPLLFSQRLDDPIALKGSLMVFVAYCAAASGIYLWNDSFDWRSDLSHPDKRSRPIPSGRLGVPTAIGLGAALIVFGVASGLILNWTTGVILTVYVLLNYLYSVWLKNVVIMDIMCIAMGFVFRVMAGSSAINVKPSHWLLMCTFLLALFLGIAKRRNEIRTLTNDSSQHRRVLGSYSMEWLDQAGTMVAGATIVAYALYTVSPETQASLGTDKLVYTLPLVVFGILRYLHMMHADGQTGNPSSALFTDKPLLSCLAGWAATCAALIYL